MGMPKLVGHLIVQAIYFVKLGEIDADADDEARNLLDVHSGRFYFRLVD